MNRKSKVIVSIVGITIVLLALLGITYAYYLTRIEGNTNTNSISITTADLKLVYRDGNGHVSKENIMPGTTIEKTFTVENTGNNKVDNYAVYLEEIVNTLTRTEDLTYILECTSTSGTCLGGSGEFPKLATDIVVNSIDTGVTHTYKLTVIYENLETVDQSEDMGSVISGFVQIYAMKDILDIEGMVEDYANGDYAQINSVQKRSQIVEGNYKFAGVLPGTHTIKICGKEDTNCTSPKLSQQIVLNVGTEAKVEDNKITMTDNSHSANIDINVSNGNVTIGSEIKEYNPFKEGTLAYNIYKNSKDNKNGTQYVETPPSKVAEEISLSTWDLGAEKYVYEKNENLINYYSKSYDSLSDCIWSNKCDDAQIYTGCTDDVVGSYYYYYLDSDQFGRVEKCHNGKIVTRIEKPESVLSSTLDDYGISYYYRGNVQDNYVNFAGMCWKIMRIVGDGSVKLILEDQDELCSENIDKNSGIPIETGGDNYYAIYGYEENPNDKLDYIMNYLEPKINKDKSVVKAFYNFQTNKLTGNLNKLKSGDWCLGDAAYSLSRTNEEYNYTLLGQKDFSIAMYYDSYVRLNGKNTNPTLKCNGTVLNEFKNVDGVSIQAPMYVSTFTVDELIFAGASIRKENSKFYLINENFPDKYYGYFWTLSPSYFNDSDSIYYYSIISGYVDSISVINGWYLRPSISLKAEILSVDGDGTINNPYVIN